jgi:hypothetical protein|tara:strand:- start:687 stop:926 length:240 start_codon:yes stop_codon:yes gene_type:complete
MAKLKIKVLNNNHQALLNMALNGLINNDNFKQCITYKQDIKNIEGLLTFLGDSSIQHLKIVNGNCNVRKSNYNGKRFDT